MSEFLNKSYDIGIIGGGASGLAAAIEAKNVAKKDISVVIFESQSRVGKKLIATGNGRCNYTNVEATLANYHGEHRDFVEFALGKNLPSDNINFFRKLGVYPRYESGGKVYPYSNQASSLVDVLRFSAENLGVEIATATEVTSISQQNGEFKVQTADNSINVSKVIIAMGGIASPDLGGSTKGYDLAKTLGHRVGSLSPALVQIKTENTLPKALKGIKFEGNVALKRGNDLLGQNHGEILFTEYGLSGPPILQLSCLLVGQSLEGVSAQLDFFPKISEGELFDILMERRKNLYYLNLENYLTGLMNKKVAQLLLKRILDRQLSFGVAGLTDEDIAVVAKGLKDFSMAIQGVTGWKNAQVTAGGVNTLDVLPETMESRIVKGLYFCGEILDIHGDCGGFNLQWAWSSGRLAAESAVDTLETKND